MFFGFGRNNSWCGTVLLLDWTPPRLGAAGCWCGRTLARSWRTSGRRNPSLPLGITIPYEGHKVGVRIQAQVGVAPHDSQWSFVAPFAILWVHQAVGIRPTAVTGCIGFLVGGHFWVNHLYWSPNDCGQREEGPHAQPGAAVPDRKQLPNQSQLWVLAITA